MRLNGVVDNLHKWILPFARPGSESEFAARLKDAKRFRGRALGIGQMKKREIGDDAIEAAIGERKILRVALAELDMRKHFSRDRDHLFRKIETGRNGAAFGSSGGDVTGAATDIQ